MVDTAPSQLVRLAEITAYLTERDACAHISEQQFRGFGESFPAPAWLKNARLELVWNNAASRKLFPDIRPGQTEYEWLSPDEAEISENRDRHVLNSNCAMQFVRRIVYGDGEHVWLIVKFPVPYDGDTYLGGMAFDLTDSIALLAAAHAATWSADARS